MLHKPTQRKLPKKYENAQKVQDQQMKKASSKPVMRSNSNAPVSKGSQRQNSVRGKVTKVEQKINKVVGSLNNLQLQNMLIQQIKGIKSQLKQIKQHIGIHGSVQKVQHMQHMQYNRNQEQQQEEQNIYNVNNMQNNSGQHKKQIDKLHIQPITQSRPVQQKNQSSYQQNHQAPTNTTNSNYKLFERPKQLMDVGKIQPYMKQFKIQVSKSLMPYYHGYHKKSSKPVIIKYCSPNKSMQSLFNLYERLWKNIVKAKNICLNKIYDLNQPLATYILVIQANKHSLLEILSLRIANVSQILCSLIRALQFFHQCGYLYRNIHPYHVMYSYQNQIVLIDLKNMKKFVDIKGKHMAVVRDSEQIEDEFISNNRARGLKQGRKDDLQSLGYLALFILDGYLPWNVNNLVQVRSKLTIKQLCGKYPGLLQYMITVAQMQTEDVPDYNKLSQSLASI